MAASGVPQIAHRNRLSDEESPYLLQHQHNPVDWYPWGSEAFEKAKTENKPIFLSIGYSTCHWCHVMERESFENEATAAILNKYYVSIKVDREERADVDKVYMTYVQATTGSGGWPMSVFLTPALQPFLGGTYFHPEDLNGRSGFKTVLNRVAEAWAFGQDKIESQSMETMEQLRKYMRPKEALGPVSDSAAAAAVMSCAHLLAQRFDESRGGFGNAPKFPRPAELNALLIDHLREQDPSNASFDSGRSLHMALLTLDKMAAGGIHDHVGGGFHRYSVDEVWHVPHFEKMLYDTPQLANTYLTAFRVTREQRFARTAADILDYMLRDLCHPNGGFYSAEDADSLDEVTGEKKEGVFYLWTEHEIDKALGSAKSPIFKRHYHVKASGNTDLSLRSNPHREFDGLNCLIERHTLADTAANAGITEAEAEATLAECREILHGIRAKRPRPHLDDKVVAAWNGMSISALANASRVLANNTPQRSFPVEGRPASEYLAAAQKTASAVLEKLADESTGRLRRSFRNNPSVAEGFADDYAYVIEGLLDLYQADGDPRWLQWSYRLQSTMDELFWDSTGGGYFATTGDDKSILLRMKEDYDGAEPSSSSIAASNLFRLAAFSSDTEGQRLRKRGVATTAAFAQKLDEMAVAMPQMCCSLFLQSAGHLRQVVISGRQGAADTEALINAAHAASAVDKVIIFVDPSLDSHREYWKEHNPEAWSMVEPQARSTVEGSRAVAYVCQNYTCQAPTSDAAQVAHLLHQGRHWAPSVTAQPADAPRLTAVDISKLTRS